MLFEQSSDAHLLFDDGGIIDCNAAALTLMRCTDKARLLGVHPARLSPERQPDGRLSAEKGDEMCALARQNGSHQFEWLRLALDGTEIPVDVTLTALWLNDKPVLLSVWHNLTERKQAEQQINDYMVILEFQKSQLEETNLELEALATTDGLTGLKNRRTFNAKLAEEHARAVRYHQPLSLLLLDVDHFKTFNDAFGHPAGDAVLCGAASALRHTARDTDMAARYGGEEFAVILPQTDEAGALVIAERVRTGIADAEWQLRPITVSVGVCTLSLDTPTPESMIACADRALYYSKEAGRDRTTHGNPAAPLVSLPCPPGQPSAAPPAPACSGEQRVRKPDLWRTSPCCDTRQIIQYLLGLYLPFGVGKVRLEAERMIDSEHGAVRVGVAGADKFRFRPVPEQPVKHGRFQALAETMPPEFGVDSGSTLMDNLRAAGIPHRFREASQLFQFRLRGRPKSSARCRRRRSAAPFGASAPA